MQSSPTKESIRTEKPTDVMLFIYGWAANNMFRFRTWDGVLYTILYILVPVFMTWISLYTLKNDLLAAAYCYFSIMISAANCLYDAFGRWDKKIKSVKNIKLALIIIACFIAFAYGLFQFLVISIGQTLELRNDAILCMYFIAVAIVALDIIALFGRESYIATTVRD